MYSAAARLLFAFAVPGSIARSEARHDARPSNRPPEPEPGPQVATLYTWTGTWTRSPLDQAGVDAARARRVPVYVSMHEMDAHLPGKYPHGAVVLDGVSR